LPSEIAVRPSLPDDFYGFIMRVSSRAEQQACSHSLLNFPSCPGVR
jgi:hypothetical protein